MAAFIPLLPTIGVSPIWIYYSVNDFFSKKGRALKLFTVLIIIREQVLSDLFFITVKDSALIFHFLNYSSLLPGIGKGQR